MNHGVGVTYPFEWLESLELWKECATGLPGLAEGLWGNGRHRVYLYDARGGAILNKASQLMSLFGGSRTSRKLDACMCRLQYHLPSGMSIRISQTFSLQNALRGCLICPFNTSYASHLHQCTPEPSFLYSLSNSQKTNGSRC